MEKEGKVKKILVVDDKETFRSGLLANSPTPINVINPDTSIRYVSPALEKLTGFSADELIGQKPPYPYWPKEDVDKIMKGFKKAMRQGSDRVVELYQKKNGERFWVEITSTPVRKDGKIQYLLASWVDITERKKAEEALQKGEKNYKLLFESTLDGLFVLDAETMKVVLANQAAADIYGLNSAEEAIGVNLLDFVPPEEREQVLRIIVKDMFENDLRQVNEFRTITKDGREIWISAVGTRTEYQGKMVGLVSFRDITERKQTEEKLRESEEKYRELAESITDVFFAFDKDLRYTYWNKASEELTGISAEDALGKHLHDIFPDSEMTKRVEKVYLKALRTQKVQSFVNEYQLGDKDYFFEINAYPSKDGLSVFVKDITERKLAGDTLKESEEKYKTLVEATSDIIWEVDTEGRFTFVSPKIKDVLGYEVDEVVGKMRTLDFAPKKEARKWLKRFKEINAKKTPFSGFEIAHLHKNGTPVIFETSGIPLFDSDGNFKGFVGINKDITERRRMQEQLFITDRLASVGELAAGIAHELNNPLTGVIGFSQLLMDKEIPEDIKQDVQVVYSEAQRAAQVVRNLLTFARKHAPSKQSTNVNSIIEGVLTLRAYEQRVENITIKGRLASDLPEVMTDYFQLQQVFLNIIINAEHFMKEAHNRGNLTITTEQVGNKVRASFADDGPGIGADDLGHIFDPFFTTKEVGKGTGLGLSICHGIIAEHGGRIHVESELGKGATFIVELPISAADKKGGAG